MLMLKVFTIHGNVEKPGFFSNWNKLLLSISTCEKGIQYWNIFDH